MLCHRSHESTYSCGGLARSRGAGGIEYEHWGLHIQTASISSDVFFSLASGSRTLLPCVHSRLGGFSARSVTPSWLPTIPSGPASSRIAPSLIRGYIICVARCNKLWKSGLKLEQTAVICNNHLGANLFDMHS